VNQNAVDNHRDHDDKLGSCGAHCESLCNDSNACTIDGCIPGTETCQQPSSRQPVDCNDTEVCTADSCNPTTGCVYTAQVGASCNDGNAPDGCTYRPKDCAGQFGNNSNYTYSCEVVGTEGVCRATPN
jgi:hypothetical protein